MFPLKIRSREKYRFLYLRNGHRGVQKLVQRRVFPDGASEEKNGKYERCFSWTTNSKKIIHFVLFRKLGTGVSNKHGASKKINTISHMWRYSLRSTKDFLTVQTKRHIFCTPVGHCGKLDESTVYTTNKCTLTWPVREILCSKIVIKISASQSVSPRVQRPQRLNNHWPLSGYINITEMRLHCANM
jgi:hypothetical protein